MSESPKTGFDFSEGELLASSLHAQVLARRRATLEHDIKNVLHGLMSGTELLGKSLSVSSARITPAECLNLLQQQLARAQTTLHHILDEVAPPPQSAVTLELSQLTAECTHALRHQLQTLNVQSAVAQDLKVRVVPARCRDALLSLLLDCVDRMPQRSALTLRAERIDAEAIALVIEHPQTSSAASSAIVTITKVFAADEVQLRVADNEQTRTLQLTFPAGLPTQKLQLLIIDGSRDAADSLALLAELEGVTAIAAYDLDAALEQIRTAVPRCVLIDLDGSLDHRTLIRTIRTLPPPQPRVVGLSHSAIDSDEGLDADIRKPLDIAALRSSFD